MFSKGENIYNNETESILKCKTSSWNLVLSTLKENIVHWTLCIMITKLDLI